MTTQLLRASLGRNPVLERLAALFRKLTRKSPMCLRLRESLPLGERRFVAVVEFERARFLVGGTPSSLVLLSRLEDSRDRTEDGEGSGSSPSAGRSVADQAGTNRWDKRC